MLTHEELLAQRPEPMLDDREWEDLALDTDLEGSHSADQDPDLEAAPDEEAETIASLRERLAAEQNRSASLEHELNVVAEERDDLAARLVNETNEHATATIGVAEQKDSVIHERDEALTQEHHKATHDELTGLLNRTGQRAIVDQIELNGPQNVMVHGADLVNFKQVNDDLGHEIGDAVLVAAAKELTAAAGEDATVIRKGGDEFLVIAGDPSEKTERRLGPELQDRQLEKAERNKDVWNNIHTMVATYGKDSVRVVQPEQAEDGTELEPYLEIGGQRVADVSELAIIATGRAEQTVASGKDFRALEKEADGALDEEKDAKFYPRTGKFRTKDQTAEVVTDNAGKARQRLGRRYGAVATRNVVQRPQ